MVIHLKHLLKSYIWAMIICALFLLLYGNQLSFELLARYVNQAIPWCLVLLGEYLILLMGNIYYAAGGQLCILTAGMAWVGSYPLSFAVPMTILITVLSSVLLGGLCGFMEEKMKIPVLLFTIALHMMFSGVGGYIREHRQLAGNLDLYHMAGKQYAAVIGLLILLMAGGLVIFLQFTTIGRRLSILKAGERQMREEGISVLGMKVLGYIIAFLLIGIGAFFYYMKIGGSVNFNSDQVTYDVMTALGIGGIYRLRRDNMVPRAILGSLGLVLLHLITMTLGCPSAVKLCIGGVIILTSFGMRTSSKDCTT